MVTGTAPSPDWRQTKSDPDDGSFTVHIQDDNGFKHGMVEKVTLGFSKVTPSGRGHKFMCGDELCGGSNEDDLPDAELVIHVEQMHFNVRI